MAEHPQFAARQVVGSALHPKKGEFRQLALLLAGMDRSARMGLPDPDAIDTEHLLKEAGVDGQTVATWVARGAVA